MTIKRITFVQELLAFMGLEGRLHLAWISSAEAQKFVRVVTDFTEKIRTLGPNPLTGFSAARKAAGLETAAGLANRHPNQPLRMQSTHLV
jgi:F420-non-reducing hydrogenase iron-sulfur subunit